MNDWSDAVAEEGHFHWTISEFEKLVRDYGVEAVCGAIHIDVAEKLMDEFFDRYGVPF